MIDENLFTTEIHIPEEFESMLNVSLKHEKLQNLMKFIIQVLQRHENALKSTIDKTKAYTSEFQHLEKSFENLNTRQIDHETKIEETLEMFKSFEEELLKKMDSSESLKFALEMTTKHDFLIASQQKDLQEIKTGHEKIVKSVNELEKLSKVFQANLDKINSEKNNEKRRISKVSAKIMQHVEESALHDDSIALSESKDEVPLKIQLQEIEQRKNPAFAVEGRRLFTEERSKTEKRAKIEDNFLKTSENSLKPSETEENSSKSEEKYLKQEELMKKQRNRPHVYEAIFPYPNKNYTETEKTLQLSPEGISKSPSHLSLITTSRMKQLENRVEFLERVLAESEPAAFFNKLENIEKTFKFYESVLDKLEPEIMKNRLNIRKIMEKMTRFEREIMQKTNTDQFDSFKNLVIALASGSNRKTLPILNSTSSQDQNYAENFEKRLSELETFYIASKITSINFEEISYKLIRIEQKLDFKLDSTELDFVNQNISNLAEQLKTLSLEGNKNIHPKPGDQNHLSSLSALNRKIIQLEASLKMFSIPPGLSFQSLNDEIKKLWESVKLLLSSLETYTSTFKSKFDDLSLTGFAPNIEKIKKTIEKDLKLEMKDLTENFDKKFADKFEMLRGFKFVESVLNKLEGKISRNDAEEAILARKPLAGWTCGSCEKHLDKLSGRTAGYVPWGKLPGRDPKERILKAGSGFGNMILQLEPIKKRENGLSMTERSATPTPMV
jgi:hypothetical protein